MKDFVLGVRVRYFEDGKNFLDRAGHSVLAVGNQIVVLNPGFSRLVPILCDYQNALYSGGDRIAAENLDFPQEF